jgi:hypothetical protein
MSAAAAHSARRVSPSVFDVLIVTVNRTGIAISFQDFKVPQSRDLSTGRRELAGMYGLLLPAPNGVMDKRPGGIGGQPTEWIS